jgi:Na+/glutamate symporter
MKAWDKTKQWVGNNRVVSGALAGTAIGVGFGGVGIVPGAIIGAGVGWWSKKETNASETLVEMKKDSKNKNVQ